MMFHTHTNHVQENADHDEDVEFLIGSQIEEESCESELEDHTGDGWLKMRRKNSNGLVVLGELWSVFCFPFFSLHCNISSDHRS